MIDSGPAVLAGATTTAEYIRTHRSPVQHYVNALVKAVKWLHTAPNEEIVKLVPTELYGGDKDIFDKVLTANKGIYTALDTGRLSAKQPIGLKKIFVSELLHKANGQSGGEAVCLPTLKGKQRVGTNT